MRLGLRILPLLMALTPGLIQAASPAKPKAKTDNILPLKVTEKTLPNGLKVIVVPTGFPNLVSLQIPVLTGSRNEVEEGKTGFAHFFEHMMFRGTKNTPPEVYQGHLTRMGARQNAYTTNDFTNYHTTFSKDDLELMMKIEADRFQNLEYPESAFKTEARAVLGEYNKNSANPMSKLYEATKDKAFTTHTYKHTTMGFIKDIEDMPNQYAYSKVFFDRWYRPENTAIIVAGDVEPAQVMKLVEKYWSSWKPGSFKANIPKEPPAQGPVYVHVPWSSPTPPMVSVAFHGPAFSVKDKDYAALDLFFDLAFGETSDIYKQLVIDEQKVTRLGAMASSSQDPDLFAVNAMVKDVKDVPYVRDAIMKVFAKSLSEPISADRLNEVRSNIRYSFARRLDNTESIASTLATFVRYERKYETLNQYFNFSATITPADVQKAAQKYFTDKNLVVSTLSQEALPETTAKLPALASFQPARAQKVNIPVIAQKNQIPLLNIKLQFKVGSAQDPAGKEGLAYLAASMISDAGSQPYRYDELQKALFPMAAGFGSLADKEVTTFTISTHKDHAQKVIGLLTPSLLAPGFRDEDFQRLKSVQLNNLKNSLRNNNEEELGKERLQEWVFAGTPYGHPVIGTVKGLESITLDDVKNFVKKAYTRSNVTIGVNGDISNETLAMLQNELSQLPEGPALAPAKNIAGAKPKGLEVNIIEKGTRATAISFGAPIEVTRSHPDFAALWLARSWLGEHRSSMSHLYERIREVRGMNYGDYAYIEAFPGGMYSFFPSPNIVRQAQLFEVWIRPVQPENAHHALRIALYELDKLIKNGLSQDDFEKTREYIMKNVFVMTATQDQQIGYALDSAWYGTPEYTSYMRDRLSKLTLDDVNKAIRKHFSAQNLRIVMITQDAQGLKKRLASDAVSTVKYDGEKPQELLDEDKLIGSMKLNIPESAISITKVDDVFKDAAPLKVTASSDSRQ